MKRWMIIALLFAVGLWLVPYSVPLLFALATALLLEPSIRRLQENYKLKRAHAVTVIFSLFIIILGLSLYFLVVIFVQQVMALSQKLPYVLNEATKVLDRLIQTWQSYSSSIPQEIIDSLERGVNTVEQMLLSFATNLTQSLVHYIAAIPAFLIHFLVYLIALFLICLDLPQLKQGMRRYLSERTEQRLGMVVAQLSKAGIGFLKAQFLLSLITFFLALAGLFVLGVDYAALMALVIVVVDILPILGTGSVLVPWGLISMANGNNTLGIGLIVLFVVITVVRRIIEPKVFSTNLGISPLAALVSVYLGFQLLGFIGLFVGPVVVILVEALAKAGVIKWTIKL
ncbi:sporulation integral membrane protein YtvI [Geobacillus zalihae]|uniref:Sporulation integral membrane protein YtvI n=1 Tax=Geobacillus zalihae TaxID=213419 RepID=A0A7H1RZH1_9BACL|nr:MULTISPECIES: sporulation integral membrane protein YtvI [Geobacillus]EPR27752.1 putative membrane spanning protein [Geobacillus sp. WSUCF1]OQP24542.1 sporulation integral membrane protein YtvI [Geobacillus zalihae]QNU19660.1 sporulation integral membrane protein YtvI [Geobacillus zalihae]WKA46574.1 sporulation integral membrane protein YtvI [Geobacillus zalihae]WMJ19161.1 sporulation integral membrane protein YtvI [Geobacillus kaustophilus]